MKKAKAKTARRSAPADLEAASAEFDQPDFAPRFAKAPVAEQRRHDRALRRVRRKRGRPTIGQGVARIQVTVERALLAETDDLARREQISRSELIARGLRLALAS